jgi:hypothetical protein
MITDVCHEPTEGNTFQTTSIPNKRCLEQTTSLSRRAGIGKQCYGSSMDQAGRANVAYLLVACHLQIASVLRYLAELIVIDHPYH